MEYTRTSNEMIGERPIPVCEPTMPQIMNEVHLKGIDALQMARRINACLFGTITPDDANKSNACCLMHTLHEHNYTLTMLYEELARMMDKMGC